MWQLLKSEFDYDNWIIGVAVALILILYFVVPNFVTIENEKNWRLALMFAFVAFFILGRFDQSISKDKWDRHHLLLPVSNQTVAHVRIVSKLIMLFGGALYFFTAHLIVPLSDPGFKELIYLGFIGISLCAWLFIIYDLRQIFPKYSSPWGDALFIIAVIIHVFSLPWMWRSTLMPFVVSPFGFVISVVYAFGSLHLSTTLFSKRASYLG